MLKNWTIQGDKVLLSYDQGDLYVALDDFNRAFGAIVNAPYDAVKRDFAIKTS